MIEERKLWAVALWVETNYGDDGEDYIAGQIHRTAQLGEDGRAAIWRTIGERFRMLREGSGMPS